MALYKVTTSTQSDLIDHTDCTDDTSVTQGDHNLAMQILQHEWQRTKADDRSKVSSLIHVLIITVMANVFTHLYIHNGVQAHCYMYMYVCHMLDFAQNIYSFLMYMPFHSYLKVPAGLLMYMYM